MQLCNVLGGLKQIVRNQNETDLWFYRKFPIGLIAWLFKTSRREIYQSLAV